jgi:inosine/xanthosine triphosphatase
MFTVRSDSRAASLRSVRLKRLQNMSILAPNQIFVGSTNPVKVQAVQQAAQEQWPETLIVGLEVASGVAAQPMSDEATRLGADQRAKAALQQGLQQFTPAEELVVLGIGLEGGVFQPSPTSPELWSTVWISVVTQAGEFFRANGARFQLPVAIAKPILAGEEMGVVVGNLTGNPNIKQEHGTIGLITQQFITRTTEYSSIVRLALGLWYGRDWEQTVH